MSGLVIDKMKWDLAKDLLKKHYVMDEMPLKKCVSLINEALSINASEEDYKAQMIVWNIEQRSHPASFSKGKTAPAAGQPKSSRLRPSYMFPVGLSFIPDLDLNAACDHGGDALEEEQKSAPANPQEEDKDKDKAKAKEEDKDHEKGGEDDEEEEDDDEDDEDNEDNEDDEDDEDNNDANEEPKPPTSVNTSFNSTSSQRPDDERFKTVGNSPVSEPTASGSRDYFDPAKYGRR